jgi:hypothetical protein
LPLGLLLRERVTGRSRIAYGCIGGSDQHTILEHLPSDDYVDDVFSSKDRRLSSKI